MNTILELAFVALVGAVVLVTLTIIGVRALRLGLDRRRDRLAAAPRRTLLTYLADGGPADGLQELLDIPGPAWRAVEPTAAAMLAKLRGETRDALATVFERRGIGHRALADLDRHDPVRRAGAAEILGSLRRRDAVLALCARLSDRDPEVRLVAIRALGHIGDPAATGPLLATLATTDPAPVHLVADALEKLDSGADAALLDALTHPEARVRATVLDTLRLRGTTGAEALVITALYGDESDEVRRRAAAVLGRTGGRAALDPLLRAANLDPSTAVRSAAARALGDLGQRAAVPGLVGLLEDRRHRVAHEAAGALTRLGEPGLGALREVAAAHHPAGAPGTGTAHAKEALAATSLGAALAAGGVAR